MSDVEYVTIGEVTLDDTVLLDGNVYRGQTGGGSIYSAIGLRIWSGRVGVNSVVGAEYPDEALRFLDDHGIDTRGISRIEGFGLRLWLLHEEDNIKQQVVKRQSATFHQLDEARRAPPPAYWKARGFHLAPATPEGQMRARALIREHAPRALISLDILVEPFIDAGYYTSGEAIRGVDIFTPSIVEVQALWGEERPVEVFRRWAEWGVRWAAIKMDTRGALVADLRRGEYFHVPIYPARTVDPTGAGDAFSGGFLAGIGATGDAATAGVWGTVSASFAVEHFGAFDILRAQPWDAAARIEVVRPAVRPVDATAYPH